MSSNKYVKIIHGSIVPWKSKKSQIKWMYNLGAFLKEKGINVSYFIWSGFPLFAFSERTINRFISEISKNMPKDDYELYIFGKSLGAEIVERALNKLEENQNSFYCKAFIRIAGPDPDYHHNVGKLVDVSARNDFLDPLGTIFSRKIYKDMPKDANIIKLDLGKLKHIDLNKNILIESGKFKGKNIYDVYYELIS